MDHKIAFLNARLDAAEWEANAVKESAAKRTHYRASMIASTERDLRDVAAKRAILAELDALPHMYIEDCYYSCPQAVEPGEPGALPGSGFCNDNAVVEPGACWCGRDEFVTRMQDILAAIYSDHPGYDPAWAPS
jgi:hypothetical protein